MISIIISLQKSGMKPTAIYIAAKCRKTMLKSNINHRQQWKSWGAVSLGHENKKVDPVWGVAKCFEEQNFDADSIG